MLRHHFFDIGGLGGFSQGQKTVDLSTMVSDEIRAIEAEIDASIRSLPIWSVKRIVVAPDDDIATVLSLRFGSVWQRKNGRCNGKSPIRRFTPGPDD